MLPRGLVKSSWVPTIRMTSFFRSGVVAAGVAAPAKPIPSPIFLQGAGFDPADKVMPTPLIGVERQEDKNCGTGQPAQRGHRKGNVWQRRHPWFSRQWTLDMKRVTKGPSTPFFPEGVPFEPIRKLKSFAGRSFRINAGRRRKVRLSLKRGRRKLL